MNYIYSTFIYIYLIHTPMINDALRHINNMKSYLFLLFRSGLRCLHPLSKGNIKCMDVSLSTSSICKAVRALEAFHFLFPACLCLCLFLSSPSLYLPLPLSFPLPPSTYTNTNKHSCHSGLLLWASESLQMGTAKCRCHSASVPKKQGHLLWSQVTTGRLHTHARAADPHTHAARTRRVQTHRECKQTYIIVLQLQAHSDMTLAPTPSGTYFQKRLPLGARLLLSSTHVYVGIDYAASGYVWTCTVLYLRII